MLLSFSFPLPSPSPLPSKDELTQKPRRYRLCIEILPLPLPSARHRGTPGEESAQGDGEAEEGPEAGETFRGGVSFFLPSFPLPTLVPLCLPAPPYPVRRALRTAESRARRPRP